MKICNQKIDSVFFCICGSSFSTLAMQLCKCCSCCRCCCCFTCCCNSCCCCCWCCWQHSNWLALNQHASKATANANANTNMSALIGCHVHVGVCMSVYACVCICVSISVRLCVGCQAEHTHCPMQVTSLHSTCHAVPRLPPCAMWKLCAYQ